MNRCIQLAKNGLGSTFPNPMVGCVLVYEDKIIGEGWHQKAGLPHAEVRAINSVNNPELIQKSKLYVSLEPCSHFGKTPPCTDLIIKKGIRKVIIGSKDPNPLVAGSGIRKLREAGIDVIEGVLAEECNDLNKRFFTFHKCERPYLFLKWAETSDGFIAPTNKEIKEPIWITNELSRQWVHKMRAQEGAILIGAGTLREDSPMLSTRHWEGSSPLRIIISKHTLDAKEIPLAEELPSIVFHAGESSESRMTKYVQLDGSKSTGKQVCDFLYSIQIQSLIIEGGRTVLQHFIDEDLWDEAFIFKGKVNFNEGVPAPNFDETPIKSLSFDGDILLNYKNSSH